MKSLPKIRLPRPKNITAAEDRLICLNEDALNENFSRITDEIRLLKEKIKELEATNV